MRASRIFAFARTMRCATVGGGVRNARAISSVVRPQTSRSVSAICASGVQRGMAAGEDRAAAGRPRRRLVVARSRLSALTRARAASASSPSDASNRARAPQRVDRLEAAGRDEPRARIRRDAVARPLLERRGERVVQRLLGEIEVAEEADERGEHAPRLGAVDVRRSASRDALIGHRSTCCANSMIGRTSIAARSRAEGIRDAIWIASFRSLASIR